MKSLYLLLNLATIAGPLLRSFEPRIHYVGKWRALLPAIGITALVFIAWDIAFTQMGVWGFNERYLTGASLLGLPIEEWLFFITIPYACIFIYEVLNHFIHRDLLGPWKNVIGGVLLLASLLLCVLHLDQWYTATTFGFLCVLLSLHIFYWKTAWLGKFFLAYGVALIPFFVVNGILTGTGIEEPVVWYNDAENLGLRLGTIPFEDAFYGMALILLNVTVYERLKGKT